MPCAYTFKPVWERQTNRCNARKVMMYLTNLGVEVGIVCRFVQVCTNLTNGCLFKFVSANKQN